jgi:hypothetical protein
MEQKSVRRIRLTLHWFAYDGTEESLPQDDKPVLVYTRGSFILARGVYYDRKWSILWNDDGAWAVVEQGDLWAPLGELQDLLRLFRPL